jgi:hypothetical protein
MMPSRVSLTILALVALLADCSGGSGSSSVATFPALPQSVAGGSGSSVNPRNVRPLQLQVCPPTSNRSNFNGTSVNANDWIWFSSVISVGNITSPVTIYMTNSTISFFDVVQYNFTTPNATITIDPSVSQPTLTYNTSTNTWIGEYPANTSGNVFLDGGALPLTQALVGGANPVTWTATFYSSSGRNFNWAWAAAAYTSFTSTSAYNNLGVKPLDDNHYAPFNSDPAGTPLNFTSHVIGGARGGGGGNFTGSLSGTLSVTPCTPIPTPTPTPPPIFSLNETTRRV